MLRPKTGPKGGAESPTLPTNLEGSCARGKIHSNTDTSPLTLVVLSSVNAQSIVGPENSQKRKGCATRRTGDVMNPKMESRFNNAAVWITRILAVCNPLVGLAGAFFTITSIVWVFRHEEKVFGGNVLAVRASTQCLR